MSNKTSIPAASVPSLQLRVLRLGFFQEGNVRVGAPGPFTARPAWPTTFLENPWAAAERVRSALFEDPSKVPFELNPTSQIARPQSDRDLWLVNLHVVVESSASNSSRIATSEAEQLTIPCGLAGRSRSHWDGGEGCPAIRR